MASRRWVSAQPGLQPDLDQRGVPAGEQVAEARLRLLVPRARVEHDLGDEIRVVDARDAQQAVAQPEPQQLLLELGLGELAGLVAQALLGGRRVAAALGGVGGLLGQHVGLALVGLQALLEPAGDLRGGQVEEGPRPEHHPGGLGPGQLGAHRRELAQALRRHVARQAALEADEPAEVGREHQLLERPLGHDHHRVVAEVALEVLGGREGLRPAVDQRVGVHAGLEAQREHSGAQRQHADYGQRQARAAGDRARDTGEVQSARETPEVESPPHAIELRRRVRALTPVPRP